MVKYVRTGARTDVHFDEKETAFDVGAMILAICAYPDDGDQAPGGPANKFWDSIYYCISRDGRSRHRIAGLPVRTPTPRSAEAQLRKGFDRIDQYRNLATSLLFSFGSGGGLSLNPSRDLRSLDIRMRFGQDGQLVDSKHEAPGSISSFIKYHQPAFGLGTDEFGTSENEATKTLKKRRFDPMLRIIHILAALSHEIVCAKVKRGELWDTRFIHGDPTWALRVVGGSQSLAVQKVALLRQFGVRTASLDRMVHLHLPDNYSKFAPSDDGTD